MPSVEKDKCPSATPTRLFMALPSITPSSMRASEDFSGNATLAPRLPKFHQNHDPKYNRVLKNKSFEVSVRTRKVLEDFPDYPDSDIGEGWPAPTSPDDTTIGDTLGSKDLQSIDHVQPEPMFKSKTRQRHAVDLKHRAEHIIKKHLRQANSRNKDLIDFYGFDN